MLPREGHMKIVKEVAWLLLGVAVVLIMCFSGEEEEE